MKNAIYAYIFFFVALQNEMFIVSKVVALFYSDMKISI